MDIPVPWKNSTFNFKMAYVDTNISDKPTITPKQIVVILDRLFTSTREVMFLVDWVCCLFFCLSDYLKSSKQICMKFLREVCLELRNNRLDF